MYNDKQKLSYRDWTRINLNKEYEAAYWVKRFGVSREVLEKAIRNIGPVVKDIEAFFSNRDRSIL